MKNNFEKNESRTWIFPKGDKKKAQNIQHSRESKLISTYQKGPETPYAQATFEDWRRVAAQVH